MLYGTVYAMNAIINEKYLNCLCFHIEVDGHKCAKTFPNASASGVSVNRYSYNTCGNIPVTHNNKII